MIDQTLVCRLIRSQFPKWKSLPVVTLTPGGWDNRTFRLGEEMIVRLPSKAEYSQQVEKEHYWLPRLAPELPLPIPTPLAMGEPGEGYPWKWSVYQWLAGESAEYSPIVDRSQFAVHLAQFLRALQRVDAKGGPQPGPHNFYRGGSLKIYEKEVEQAIASLNSRDDAEVAAAIWKGGVETTWSKPLVWVHGDISPGNLLIQKGELSSVIDFGLLAVGDPACDLAISWALFHGESRAAFKKALALDEGTWARGRAWALWKALITPTDQAKSRLIEILRCP